jgi:hypothetical protein
MYLHTMISQKTELNSRNHIFSQIFPHTKNLLFDIRKNFCDALISSYTVYMVFTFQCTGKNGQRVAFFLNFKS